MYKYNNFPAPKCSFLILLLVFLFGIFSSIINVVNALPADIPGLPDISNPNITNPTTTVAQSSGELTPHEIVVGIILIVTGCIYCFFGRRVYYLTLFLIGFYIGAIAMWMALTNNEPPNGFSGANSPTIILLVSLAAGLFLGLLFICCAEIAIWLLGALAGYLFALFILAWAPGGVIHSSTGRIIFIVVCVLIGLLLTCFFIDTIIIVATAFIGAYAIILGVDMFVRTGFSQSVVSFLNGNLDIPPYDTNTKIYIMLGAMVVLFIIGAFFQHRFRTEKFYPQGRAPHYSNIGNMGSKFKNVGKGKQSEKSEKPANPA
ncbi:20577_t:CDS:2 [Cetraspora pellucida]|uniref:Transmembrane protein 198 n=1 Tax=Cetraspora pellucida TaxID=1433469 RepID=A0A9N9BHB7_9GLOM|nr:20577_t:CDS:2 [Cetraspora pellucida]